MKIVVGSGPSGISCAQALLDHGEEVCLVDAGVTLEPERQAVIARMGRQRPAEWSAEDLGRIKEGMNASAGGVMLKRVYGSDFAYRGPAEHLVTQTGKVALMPTLAQGGLSNVWGAALLPYHARDLHDWPITVQDLAPHYEAVMKLTPLAGRRDRLEECFPLYGEPKTLPMSGQARALWRRLEKHAGRLGRRGLQYGAARVAVQAGESGCVTCGLCMYGCPYGFIYNSAHTLGRWRERPGFTYRPGIVVDRVEETGGEVKVSGYHMESGQPWSMRADRVFLAGGVLPTTKIVLHSRGAYGRPLHILDSQYYLFPLLQAARTPRVREEALYTLSQIFLELIDPAISEHFIHLQIYSYNDLIGQALRKSLGPLGFDWLVRELENRMLVAQGYLHSNHSARLRVELRPGTRASELLVEAEPNPKTAALVRKVVRKLAGLAPTLGALPLEPMLQVTPPGRGFHCGGSLPMREQPGEFETDRLGRPGGWERIHVVDSSVFPSIPATTITLSVMANAHRIGAAVCQ
ncbi:MAG TPA: GMC oxidoreductase [Chthoniobacteraceae bacterium]|jgi:choline dehydrogenase-like flavoprotein|nr:GMC oxidoreductase [Chthoniobacteraceae bacterium]